MATWVARAPVAVGHRPGDRVGPPSRRRHDAPRRVGGATQPARSISPPPRARPRWTCTTSATPSPSTPRRGSGGAPSSTSGSGTCSRRCRRRDARGGERRRRCAAGIEGRGAHGPASAGGHPRHRIHLGKPEVRPRRPGAPFPAPHRTRRRATYRGPGQLVIYPIVNLQDGHHRPDLHWYAIPRGRGLATMESLGGETRPRRRAHRRVGQRMCLHPAPTIARSRLRTPDGASAPKDIAGREHKLAAIGVRARRWVTYHGMALNVDPNLQHFRAIVPCGIGNRPVGSVAQMLGGRPGVVSALDDGLLDAAFEGFEGEFIDGTRWPGADDALMRAARTAATDAFERVFRVRLRPRRGAPDVTAVLRGDGSGR